MAHDEGERFPRTVDEAAEKVLAALSEEDKRAVRETPGGSLIQLHFGLGSFVRNACGMWAGNDELIRACARARNPEEDEFGYLFMDPDDASAVIVEEIWGRLQPRAG